MRANYFSHTAQSLDEALMVAKNHIDLIFSEKTNLNLAYVMHVKDVDNLSIWFCYGTQTYYLTYSKDALKKESRTDLELKALVAVSDDEYYCLTDAISGISNDDLVSLVFGDLKEDFFKHEYVHTKKVLDHVYVDAIQNV